MYDCTNDKESFYQIRRDMEKAKDEDPLEGSELIAVEEDDDDDDDDDENGQGTALDTPRDAAAPEMLQTLALMI